LSIEPLMAGKPGFLQYLTAAFNARPFGMVVAPNWVGLAAAGLLGLADPGFWVLGAGLELGYLLVLATNERFRRTVTAAQISHESPGDNWTARIGKALLALGERDRLRYQTIAERCRSIIDLQEKQLSSGPVGLGLESQPDGLARLTWMYLRLLLMRHAIQKVQEDTAAAKDLPGAIALLEGRLADEKLDGELRQSIEGQIEILRQRIAHRAEAERQTTYIDSELARIEQQVELIREQAALSMDPALLSSRIDEITATLGATSRWIRDQQKVFGAMEDLLIDTAPSVSMDRAKELQ
jgi:hypothetical protein